MLFRRGHICRLLLLLLLLLPVLEMRAQEGTDGGAKSSVSLRAQDLPDDTLVALFGDYLSRYPAAELQDLYKWCFQDEYGPAHLQLDSLQCTANMLEELGMLRADDDNPDFEYTAPGGRYVRVNLRLVRDDVIPLPSLVHALRLSADFAGAPSVDEWHALWNHYVDLMERHGLRPPFFEEQKTLIEQRLKEGQYQYFHSASFNHAYCYHYRLVRREVFERMMADLHSGDRW